MQNTIAHVQNGSKIIYYFSDLKKLNIKYMRVSGNEKVRIKDVQN